MKFSPKILALSFAVTLLTAPCVMAQAPRPVGRVSDETGGAIADPGQLPHAKLPENVNDRVQYLIDRGLNFLKTQQKEDGGWQRETDPPGVTAIVLRAFVRDEKFPASTPFVKKGYDKLFSYQLDSGGIYQDLLANYNTAIAVSAIAAANEPAYQERMDKAVAFLKQLQWTEETKGPKGETVADKSNTWYGGWGYGRHGRPDLSNAQVAIEALHDAGLKPDDKAYQAALVFLSRTQNNSETNDQPWTGDDGGFVYTPANKGESMAGEFTTPRRPPRPAQLRVDDLRRLEEHDLRRPERRTTRASKPPSTGSPSTGRWTRTPRCARPAMSSRDRACTTTSTPSPTPSTRTTSRSSPTPTARRTTGGWS